MIYIDSSVILAELLVERRRPPSALWEQLLTSSRLLEYELFVRLNAQNAGPAFKGKALAILDRVDLVELSQPVLIRALDPFPLRVRTLDALHVASMEFLRGLGWNIELATYDRRMIEAAAALGIPSYAL